jgi:hypothetical protein
MTISHMVTTTTKAQSTATTHPDGPNLAHTGTHLKISLVEHIVVLEELSLCQGLEPVNVCPQTRRHALCLGDRLLLEGQVPGQLLCNTQPPTTWQGE